MKKLFLLAFLWAALALSAFAQVAGAVRVREVDGTPNTPNVQTIVFPNGTLTVSGKTVTFTPAGGAGTVTSVSWTGGIVSIANPTTTPAFTIAGTSGGIPYFNSATTWASSAALAANAIVIGGGAGVAPATTTTGTGVLTALGVNVGSAGAFVTFNGAGGTPSSLVLTNATGLPPTTGISGWPANAMGVLTNNGAGALSWGAGASGANPTASVGLAAVNGVATTYLRSDGAPALDQGIAPTWTAAHIFNNTIALTNTTAASNKITQGAAINIGTTSTDGIILQNTTAAAAGAQQYSPRLRLHGSGWKTNATAAAQDVDWAIEAQPVQGAANPTANLAFINSINGAAYTAPFLFTSTGSAQSSLTNAAAYSFSGATTTGLGISGTTPGIYVSGSFITYWGTSGIVMNGATQTIGWGTAGGFAGMGATLGIRTTSANGGSGQGNFFITSSTGTVGTSGVGVLIVANGTAPGSSPADEFQLYSADAAAGAAEAWIRNEAGEITPISGLASRNSSSFAKTSDTTLANITGLARNVAASRTYAFRAVVQTTAAVTGGVKFAISGTATATAISYEGRLEGGAALIAQTRATALDTTVCASTTATAATCFIDGVIQVNAGGTLTVQFAQNASDAGASTVLANSLFYLVPIN